MGWVIGYAIGLVIVLAVVVLLWMMIQGAKKAADQAEAVAMQLHAARDNSAGLWDVETTNNTVRRVTEAAAAARGHLEGGGA